MKIKFGSLLLSIILLLTIVEGVAAGSPTAVISAGSGLGDPGDANISVPVRLNSQDGAQVAGLNFDLSFDDSRLNVSNVTIGSEASGAGKVMSWSRPSSNTVRVIIFGLNQDTIPNGPVANVIFNVLVGAAPGTSPLTLSNAAATDPVGSGIGVALNNGSFTVLSPPATNTPTSAPSDTPIATITSTPTSVPTDTPVATSTSTETSMISPTPTLTPTLESSPTGGPSVTPMPTKTGIPSASATSWSKPTSSVTPNTTASLEATATPIEVGSATPTPPLEVEPFSDHVSAAEATGTAMAGLDAAVVATSTALALIGKEPVTGVKVTSDPLSWLYRSGDGILYGGTALGAILLFVGLILEIRRRTASQKIRKRI
jgi:hypothetical protein